MSSSLRLSPSHQRLPVGLLLLLLPSPASSTHSFASRRLIVRLPAGHPPRRCSVAAQALEPAALLERCGGDAAKLARQLSKEQLKTLCASHGLAVGGTKADLAPRLLAALQQPATPAVQAAPAVRAAPRRAPRLPQRVKGGEGRPAGSSPPPLREKAAVAEALPSQSTGCDWELTVLGSGSCNPTPWRGASCNALRVKDSIWLFDVGEGTQVQMQRCMIKASLIDRIFITHAHGDHCFGLPGLLCLISRGRRADAPPLEIYGPQGLRNFVRMSVRFTRTRMLPAYVVHELHGIPSERGRHPGGMEVEPEPWGGTTRAGAAWGEQPGGRDLSPEDARRWWTLFDDAELGVRVSAAPVRHTVPCVGYVVKEADQPGRLLPEKVMPHLQANARAIRESMGVRDPRALLKQIKQLGADEVFELPDGTRLVGREVIGQPRRGRKVVLLGDCSDASPADFLGAGADVLLHEATNAYLPWFGDRGGAHELERTTISHGHSTPQMAGLAARRMGARSLLLSHFSQRYHPAALGVMRAIKKLAVDSSQLGEDCVATAYDALTVRRGPSGMLGERGWGRGCNVVVVCGLRAGLLASARHALGLSREDGCG